MDGLDQRYGNILEELEITALHHGSDFISMERLVYLRPAVFFMLFHYFTCVFNWLISMQWSTVYAVYSNPPVHGLRLNCVTLSVECCSLGAVLFGGMPLGLIGHEQVDISHLPLESVHLIENLSSYCTMHILREYMHLSRICLVGIVPFTLHP